MIDRIDAWLERNTRRLPLIVRRNFRLKALSFGLALVAWTVVVYASNPPDTRTLNVDLPCRAPAGSCDNLPATFIVDPVPGPVAVRIRGTTDHLNQFSEQSLTVTAAFDKVHAPGTQDVALTVTNSDTNVELDSVPRAITVNIDQLTSRALPVTITEAKDKNGKPLRPPPGYIIGETASTPAEVTVTGSKHRLDSIDQLRAEADVDLSNARTTFVAQEDVVLRDATGTAITDLAVQPGTVSVHIAITSNQVSRASVVLPDLTGNAGFGRVLSGIVISPQPFVVLTGPQDLLNTLNTVSTDPIRLTNLSNGEKVTVKVLTPAGVTADPATVDVVVFFTLLPPPTATPLPSATPTPAPTPTPTPTPTH